MSNADQESSPEHQAYLEGEARKISGPHIAKIPPEDKNRITSETQVEYILNIHGGKSDQLSTYDRMGNIPENIRKPFEEGDRAGVIQALRDFANNPMAQASEVLKYYSKQGIFPESVRTQIEEIVLLEGKNRLSEAFASLADTLESDPSVDMYQVWQKARRELTSKESDMIRKMALRQTLEAVYPDLTGSAEATQWLEINRLGYEDRQNPDAIARATAKFQELTCDASFAQYVDPELVRQKIASGEIEKFDLIDVLMNIFQKLQKIMVEKFRSTK